MKVKQISVFVANQPGAISAPCRVLAEAGVDLSALMLADTKDYGVLRFIAEEWEKAVEVLKKASFAVIVTDVVAIQGDDVPGGLLKLTDLMTELNLNAEYLYAAVAGKVGKAVLIFRFEDPDEAVRKLASRPECQILSAEQFFALRKG